MTTPPVRVNKSPRPLASLAAAHAARLSRTGIRTLWPRRERAGALASAATAGGLRGLARDGLAGLVAATALITNIVSFSALMFPGALASGASTAVWALLIGSAIVGLWVAGKTSLPPVAAGLDSATGAVLLLLAASAGPALLASGSTARQAIEATMLLFTVASALSGALQLGLGIARCGAYLRFVPYFVVAGFTAATGFLLIAGGIRMTTGQGPSALLMGFAAGGAGGGVAGGAGAIGRLSCAVAVCLVFLALRRWVRRPLAFPAALVTMALAGAVSLRVLGLSDPAQGWYLPSMGTLQPWLPLRAALAEPMSMPAFLGFVPELLAVAVVALVSLVTKTSSLEVARKTAADLNVELRAQGLATLVAAPLGGIGGSMLMGNSRLLENAGGTRRSGLACALVLLAVGLLNLDLISLIPLPIAAGLVFQLGSGFLLEAYSKSLAQRDWLNLALGLAIAMACVRFGYVAGVIGGVICACLLFAASYARVGVVRQQLSRAQFAGNVNRSTEASNFLTESGEAIQVYWLSGYLFFGSSESLFDRIRSDFAARPAGRVRHVILDFAMVPAADASATVSLAKLRHFCQKQGAALLFASLDARLQGVLAREGFFIGPDARPPFADVTAALACCEDAVLAQGGLAGAAGADTNTDADAGQAALQAWLQQQLGAAVGVADFMHYLERRSFVDGQVLYRQGEAADAIDLVASGRLGVDVAAPGAQALRLRSITTQTVVGEMGFFSRATRSATVTAEGAATVLTLTRERFESLRRERPELASAFYEFLLRTLAERIRLTEKMVLAMRL